MGANILPSRRLRLAVAEWGNVGRSASGSSTPGNDSSVVDYLGADVGKTAHYMLRRVVTTGEKGPWSETARATIGA